METIKDTLRNFFAISDLDDTECNLMLENILKKIKKKTYNAGDKITIEGEPATDFQFIVNGHVRVIQQSNFGKSFICLLRPGDIIGINPHKLLDKTIQPFKRSADTVCVDSVTTYSLLLSDLNTLLVSSPVFQMLMIKKEKDICIRQFIRTLSQGNVDEKILMELLPKTECIDLPKNQTVFHQGDEPDFVYYILQGAVDVSIHSNDSTQHVLCQLQSDDIFGEIAVTSNATRNATITTLSDCVFLRISRETFNQFISRSASAHKMITSIRDSRIRPKLISNIIQHQRHHRDGTQTIVLEHPETHYFLEIPPECAAILQYLDGEHSIKDIILNLNDHNQQVNPESLFQTQYQLVQHQFATSPRMIPSPPPTLTPPSPFSQRCIQLLTYQHEFKNIETILNKLNNTVGRFVFHPVVQVLFLFIILTGLYQVLNDFNSILPLTPTELGFGIILSFALGIISVIGHEFSHGLLTHYFGGRCQRGGIGWYWITAIAFIDTTSMWSKPLKQRLLVNMAGMWFNLLFASLLILPGFFGWYTVFWTKMSLLFALFSYLCVFANLSTLLEYDGYYILSDLLDSPHLRKKSIHWARRLVSSIFKEKTNPFTAHYREIAYWIITITHVSLSIILAQWVLITLILPTIPLPLDSLTTTTILKATIAITILVIAIKNTTNNNKL